MAKAELIERYRGIRAAVNHHLNAAVSNASRTSLLQQARSLGLLSPHKVISGSEEEFALVLDLVAFSAKPGRSRGIDRYAKSASPQPGPSHALALAALRKARFSIWQVDHHHDVAGVILTDVLTKAQTWLMDEGVAASMPPGFLFASRLCWPDEFAVSCGIVVPLASELFIELVLDELACRLSSADPAALVQDPRFAAAIYRCAIEVGLLDEVAYQAVPTPKAIAAEASG